jgi:hypothetical protein
MEGITRVKVAFLSWVKRHPRVSMSLFTVENVALHDRGATNAQPVTSLGTVAWGGMLHSPCRSGRLGRATLSSMHVAWHMCARRRARAGMSPATSSSSDMQAP